MTKPPTTMATKLQRITELSMSDPKMEFKWLMPHFNKESLIQCFHELKGKKAVGIDSQTKEEYGLNLSANIEDLISRMKTMSYRPKPVLEVLIPKDNGKTRPLGISTIEDKIVQLMSSKILEAIYEPVFLDCSYGFRPGRNCHQAVKGVNDYLYGHWKPVTIDVDLENFFGSIDHSKLLAILKLRIKDATFLRYIARMLKSGILGKEGFRRSDEGTSQGSVVSPILANIFAHYAIDIWFEQVVRKNFCPQARLFRYCDDFVICCATQQDAERILQVLPKRLARFSLKMNLDKTKVVVMDKKASAGGQRQDTFDYLGFTFYLDKTRGGTIAPRVKTSSKRLRRKLRDIKTWIKAERHKARLPELWKSLQDKLRGHNQYYGVSNNGKFVRRFFYEAIRIFFKWMNRRSQKPSFSWEKFELFMQSHPPAKTTISFQLF